MVSIGRLEQRLMQQILQQAAGLVQQTINNYLMDLERHIGKIPGTGSSDLGWQPLDPDTEPGHKFWYKTGTVASHIESRIQISGNRILAVAGLPEGAPGYQEALWNEFGWTPHGTSKIVRRALFIPLAEFHLRELNEQLAQKFANVKLNIRIIV